MPSERKLSGRGKRHPATRLTQKTNSHPSSAKPSSPPRSAAAWMRYARIFMSRQRGKSAGGVELAPPYVDVNVRQYEAASGNPAVLIETGEGPSIYWWRVGQGKQHRSRVGSKQIPFG